MTQQGAEFMKRFGGTTANIDYTAAISPARQIYPTPDPHDDLEAIATKMEALARLVNEGKSLAVNTGYRSTTHQQRNPENIAKVSMTPMEKEQFESWKDGLTVPPVDWAESRKAVAGGSKAVARFQKRAKAMQVIWGDNTIDAENASWLVSEMTFALPLVIAVAKLQAAERDLAGRRSEITDMELAEVQTCHKVNAVAMDKVNQYFREANLLRRRINFSRDIIQAREQAIKAKIPASRPRSDPINKEREFSGLRPIGGQFDYTAVASDGRAPRTNLLGNVGLAPQAKPSKRPRVAVDMEVDEIDSLDY